MGVRISVLVLNLQIPSLSMLLHIGVKMRAALVSSARWTIATEAPGVVPVNCSCYAFQFVMWQ